MLNSNRWFKVHTSFSLKNWVFNVPATFTKNSQYQVGKEYKNGDVSIQNCMMYGLLTKEQVEMYGEIVIGKNPKDVEDDFFRRWDILEALGFDDLEIIYRLGPLSYY